MQKIDAPYMEKYSNIFGGTWAANVLHVPTQYINRRSKCDWGYVDRVMHFWDRLT